MKGLDSKDNVTRAFWATFLDSEVKKDGQVPGFSRFYDAADEWTQNQCDRYCYWTWIKIQRDNRDPDECIEAGVKALREQLNLYVPPQIHRIPPEQVSELVRQLSKTLSWR